MAKTFTLDEATTLLPVLSALLEKARDHALKAASLENEMQELNQRIFMMGGMHIDVPAAAKRRAEREKAMQDARTVLEEITEIGAQVTEEGGAGLEFPCLLEGRTVLLLWSLGDEEMMWWREEGDKPDVRKPLDGRFSSRKERDRPN